MFVMMTAESTTWIKKMRNELHTLQIVRGVAAMMVVTNHLLGGAFPT